MGPLLGPPPPGSLRAGDGLINELATKSGDGEMVLVLDDYHLHRLRARGKLAELCVAELRFTATEGAALLGETPGPACPVRLRRWWPVLRGGRRSYSWPP